MWITILAARKASRDKDLQVYCKDARMVYESFHVRTYVRTRIRVRTYVRKELVSGFILAPLQEVTYLRSWSRSPDCKDTQKYPCSILAASLQLPFCDCE
jgi:hypothetical protein